MAQHFGNRRRGDMEVSPRAVSFGVNIIGDADSDAE